MLYYFAFHIMHFLFLYQCRSRKRETHRKRRCVYQRIYGGNAYLRTLGRTASNYTRFNMAHYAQRIFGRPQQYRLGRV